MDDITAPPGSTATAPATRSVAPQQLAWLRTELADWTSRDLISEDQADRITARYRTEDHARSRTGRVLLHLGACFVGIGLVWLVAANLDQLSPVTRFGVVAGLWLTFLVGGEVLAARRAGGTLVGAVRLLAALGSGAVVLQAAQSLQVPAYEPRLVGLWAAGALLHGYVARAYLPFLVGVLAGVAWWFMQPLWQEQSGMAVVVLLGAGAVLSSALAVLHDRWLARFAWTWRTVAGGSALLAMFVAAVPDVGGDGVVWSGWLLVATAAAGAAVIAASVVTRGPRVLEPAGATAAAATAVLLALWTTGADASDVQAADWLHAAVSVVAYVLLAVGLLVLATVRGHAALTWMATSGLVLFTTFQSFAVFAPIVTGAWLFVVLGTVFLGTGFLVDRARRELAGALGTDTPARPTGADR